MGDLHPLIVARRCGRAHRLADHSRESACSHARLLPDWRERRKHVLDRPWPTCRSCDGMTRREWLRVGARRRRPDAARPAAPAAEAPGGSFGRAKSCILVLPLRRPGPSGHLGPQARRPGRGARRVQADRHAASPAARRRARPAHRPHGAPLRPACARRPPRQHAHGGDALHAHRPPPRPAEHQPAQPADDFPCFGAVVHAPAARPGRPAGRHQPQRAGQPGLGGQPHLPRLLRRHPRQRATTRCSSPQDPSAADFRPFPTADGATAPRLHGRRGLLAAVDAAPARWTRRRARLRRPPRSGPST